MKRLSYRIIEFFSLDEYEKHCLTVLNISSISALVAYLAFSHKSFAMIVSCTLAFSLSSVVIYCVLRELSKLIKSLFETLNNFDIEAWMLFYLPSTVRNRIKFRIIKETMKDPKLEQLQKEAIDWVHKAWSIPGKGKTCMVQGKYSREYTDYYLNQLADFLGFDFFRNRINRLELEEHQRFKPYREYLKDFEIKFHKYYVDYGHGEDSITIGCSCIKDAIKREQSLQLYHDMRFFDSLIMNNKRTINNFGFIVDKNDESIKYEFVCFYDEYTSFFDHLNGIDFENYQYALYNVLSWRVNSYYCDLVSDAQRMVAQKRHVQKMEKLSSYIQEHHSVFEHSENFMFEDFVNDPKFDFQYSVYDYHLLKSALYIPRFVALYSDDLEAPKVEITIPFETRLINSTRENYKRKYLLDFEKALEIDFIKKCNEEKRQYRLKHPESIIDPETLNLFELRKFELELVHYIEYDKINNERTESWKEHKLFDCVMYRKEMQLELEELENKESLNEEEYNEVLDLRDIIQEQLEKQKNLEESLEFYKDIRKNRDLEYIKACDEKNHKKNLEYYEEQKQKSKRLSERADSIKSF